MKFRDVLNEKFKNLFNSEDKAEYADAVFEMLQRSYEGIGGIGGSGFRSPADMIENIPMWKLSFSKGELVAAVMYKDTNGRKLVAIGSSGTPSAKKAIANILKIEFSRSYSEISGPLLKYMKRKLPEVIDIYKIKSKDVSRVIGKDVDVIDDYYYTRNIGGKAVKKIALGTINKFINK